MRKRRYSSKIVFVWPKKIRDLNLVTERLTSPDQLKEGVRLIDTTGNIRRILSVNDTHAWLTHKHGGLGKEHPIQVLIDWGNKVIIEDD